MQHQQNLQLLSYSRFFIFLLFTIISPLVGIYLFAVYIILENKFKECILPFCILIILFLACLNAVKKPESDTIGYYEYYCKASQYNLIKYIFLLGKEPVFGIFNWLIYQFVGNHPSVYGAIVTIITYSLLISSVYRFGKANRYSNYNILFGIIAIAFIPYIFTQSNHGIRQFLANSILAYIMVERIYYHKKMWIPMLIMFFIHSSSGLFIPLLFLNFLKQPIKKSNLIYYIGLILALFTYRIVGIWLTPMLSGAESLEYVASRIAQNRTGGMVMEGYMIILNIITLIGISFCIHIRKQKPQHSQITQFMHIICILILYVLSNYNQDVISLRFNFYIWVLFPFIMMFCFHIIKLKSWMYYVGSTSIYLFSFYYLEYMGVWKYNILMPVYKASLLYYFK